MSKPRFKKPVFEDEIEDGVTEEIKHEEEAASVVYNPNHLSPIQVQREKLPIFVQRQHILYLLENCNVLILTGETGSGKSTQVPQYLYEAGWAKDDLQIGISQPRRMACVNLAKRVAEETESMLGQTSGYKVRFDDMTSSLTKIKFLTEGILINEIMADPLLTKYSVIMIDEAHERSILCDMLLALLKKILKKRSDLKLIVSSATLDADSLKRFFDSSKIFQTRILSVEGRSHPVTIHYVSQPVPDYVKACAETVQKIHETQTAGNILVFLTGEKEVVECTRLIKEFATSRNNRNGQLFTVPLYSTLPAIEQLKAFQSCPPSVRKVIVATNIAETSVTINGIMYVIDCGLVKMRCYNADTGTDSLVVVPCSKSSAQQRAGRAGRIAPGKAFRLYSEDEFSKLRDFNIPEMQRSNLAWLVLHLKCLGVDNIVRFEFPSPPPSKILINAVEILYAHGALDDDGKLTDSGRKMVQFNCGVLQAKMLLRSIDLGCSSEILTIVAMMQLENVFVYPSHKSRDAKKVRYTFATEEGDLFTLLNVFTCFIQNKKNKQWCSQHFLNYKALSKAFEIRNRLKAILCKITGSVTISSSNDPDVVCKCVSYGYFTNAAYLHYSGEYRSISGDHPLALFPDSALITQRPPKFVVFSEVLQTYKLFMKHVTPVKESWLIEVAPNFFTKTFAPREVS